jgi:hypothetical protein
MVGRTARTSICEFMAIKARAAPGLAAACARAAHQRAMASSALGHMRRMSTSHAHSRSICSPYACRSSAVGAQG